MPPAEQPETTWRRGCCFDYGNAETNSRDTGNGHMEDIYFGTSPGNGPWPIAELENGFFSGYETCNKPNIPSVPSRFLTGVVKGGLNSAREGLIIIRLMNEGIVILGIGGDNSNSGQSKFYESVMTSGYPSDATENTAPKSIHRPSIDLKAIPSSSLGNIACFSFETKDTPASFIRHYNFELHLDKDDGTKLFREDATLCPQAGLNGRDISIRSWNYPTRYFCHYGNVTYAASNGDVHRFYAARLFNSDVTRIVGGAFD
ncbi:AbfB-domain-containing protein [Corynespora cassiicola Philippines]|uniref:Alpha-L-arabinofuranosidase n=1 Tax=Corynespora cassiicola Philippines TaxID=1448308 RepID=A0A2T2N2X5_CORCC|nr:AbfB-domain-containing protein [Corynespora cassiicola Philippines]